MHIIVAVTWVVSVLMYARSYMLHCPVLKYHFRIGRKSLYKALIHPVLFLAISSIKKVGKL
jgi:hypothetical protein